MKTGVIWADQQEKDTGGVTGCWPHGVELSLCISFAEVLWNAPWLQLLRYFFLDIIYSLDY